MKRNVGFWLSVIFIVLVFLLGFYDSISKSWTSDDAFISFRYAQNLVEGKGLVYNTGEKVEGYSNFLWTLLIALGMELKLDPIDLTNALGVICFALTILIFIFISWRLFRDNRPWGIFIPLTSLCLLAQAHFREFATGGLETSFFTFLISLGFAGLIFSRSRRGYLLTGLVFVLVALTRPDGILFYGIALLFLILTAPSLPKRIMYFLLPLILIFIPYYILRYLYYGYPFPNTYYARSAYLAWWSQGWYYLTLYLKAYYVFFLLPLLGVIALIKARNGWHKVTRLPLHLTPLQNSLFLSLLFTVIFTLYLVRLGGDFMFARFFIPITPFLFYLMEIFANRMLAKKYFIPFAAAVLLATHFYRYPPEIRNLSNKVVEERYFYPKERIEEARQKGAILSRYLKNTTAKVAVFGSQAMLAYYAEFPLVIEGENGLTDTYLAHQVIQKRIRPGHEKVAPVEYLFQRDVNFFFSFGLWVFPKAGDFRDIYFGDVRGRIIIYDRDLMKELRKYNEIRFTDFEEFLDDYIKKINTIPRTTLIDHYTFFKNFYFNHNLDPARQNVFENILGKE
jgi:hypothetical protein